jgi:hypothetical protein
LGCDYRKGEKGIFVSDWFGWENKSIKSKNEKKDKYGRGWGS